MPHSTRIITPFPRMWVWLTCILLLILSASRVHAQEVRSAGVGFGVLSRTADKAAEQQGRTDWPRIMDGENGTQVHVTFDFRNTDIVLITRKEVPLSKLLNEARKIARAIEHPDADYITVTGRKSTNVDIELNKYLQKPEFLRTEFEYDLSALAAALKTAELPRPIVLCLDGSEASEALLSTRIREQPERVGKLKFLGLNEIAPGTRLHFVTALPAYAPFVAFVLGGLMFFSFISLLLCPWIVARRKARERDTPSPAPDPERVQQDYNKQAPLWVLTAGLPLLLIGGSIMFNPAKWLGSAAYLLPLPSDLRSTMLLIPTLFGAYGLSSLACSLVERRRMRRAASTTDTVTLPPADPDSPPAWTTQWHLYAIGSAMVMFSFFMLAVFSGFRPPWLRPVLIASPNLVWIALGIGWWLSSRAVRTTLTKGDPWHAMVHDIAAVAGVRVRHVVRIQSTTLNGYASIFGTVGLTSALLRKLEPDEVRAVIAHEIGHLKYGHVRRSLIYSLGTVILLLVGWWFALQWIKPQVSAHTYALLRSPLVSVYLFPLVISLVLGRGRRRREEEADRFAVEYTGDPELVIRSLVRLHTLNSTPHELKKSDEALSSHPSLVHRIEAIRRLGTPSESSNATASSQPDEQNVHAG